MLLTQCCSSGEGEGLGAFKFALLVHCESELESVYLVLNAYMWARSPVYLFKLSPGSSCCHPDLYPYVSVVGAMGLWFHTLRLP